MRAFFRSFAQGFTTEFMRHRPATMTPRAFTVGALLFWLFVGSLFLAPCAARAQVPATQPFELAAQWQPWTGQVASLCGPGKNCTVKTLAATSTTNPIRLPYTGAVAWPLTGASTAEVVAPSSSVLQVNAGSGYIELNGALRRTTGGVPMVWIEDADGFGIAGAAFGSFTTCDANHSGAMQRDTTNARVRVCESGGGNWQAPPMFHQDDLTIYWPAALTTTGTSFARWSYGYAFVGGGGFSGTTTGAADLVFDMQAVVLTAGVGASTYTLTLWDEGLGSSAGVTITASCTSAAGTLNASGGSAAFNNVTGVKSLGLRLTANGCGTLPSLNVNIRQTGKDS